MNDRSHQPSFPEFGGDWTDQKLSVLRKYLNAYTTALSRLDFRTVYIDAFAGAGARQEEDAEGVQFIEGSAKVALDIASPGFDELVFIEADPDHIRGLQDLVSVAQAEDRARVEHADANAQLPIEIGRLGGNDRAVVFIDPFGTQAHWDTVASLTQYHGVDAWILFPVGTICRLMPVREKPQNESIRRTLDLIFGSASWQNLYDQPRLFGEAGRLSASAGVDAIVALYRSQLDAQFEVVADQSVSLRNSRNVRLYELLFVMTNPSIPAQDLALRIAKNIMENV